MSATDYPPPPATPAGEPAVDACPRCGAPLRADQDWCLNCGTAVTTEVAGAPAWRAPVAIVAAVLAVAAIALVLAFVELSDDSERIAQAPTATPAATAPPPVTQTPTPVPPASTTIPPDTAATPTPSPGAATTPTPNATPVPLPGATPTPSPGGTGSPTATPSPSPAPTPGANSGDFADWPAGRTAYTVILWSASTRSEAEAKARSLRSTFSTVGILNSSNYSSLRPGYYVVFNGQYDSPSAAQSAARSAQSSAPGAYAKRVKR